MKKLLAFLLITVFCVSGCGSNAASSAQSTTSDGLTILDQDEAGTLYGNVPLGYEMPYEDSTFTLQDVRVYAEKVGAYYNVRIAQIFDLTKLSDDERTWFGDGYTLVNDMIIGTPSISLSVTEEKNDLRSDIPKAIGSMMVEEDHYVIIYTYEGLKSDLTGAKINMACYPETEGTYEYTDSNGVTTDQDRFDVYLFNTVTVEEVHDMASFAEDLGSVCK